MEFVAIGFSIVFLLCFIIFSVSATAFWIKMPFEAVHKLSLPLKAFYYYGIVIDALMVLTVLLSFVAWFAHILIKAS